MKQTSVLTIYDVPLRPGGLDLTKRAVDYCGLKAGDRVVDIGCGTGSSVEWMIDELALGATGFDISAARIQTGRQRRTGLPIYQASAETLPVSTCSIAAVLAECSLSVMQDSRRVLAEACRILQTGGRLVLTDVYAHCLEEALQLRACFADDLPAVMTREEIESCLQEAGFTVSVWEDHSHVLKAYVARQLFADRPLCGCWRDSSGERPYSQEQLAVLQQIRPGYCLVAAEKERVHEFGLRKKVNW